MCISSSGFALVYLQIALVCVWMRVAERLPNTFLLLFRSQQGQFGVLSFLYSMVLTRGVDQVQTDQGLEVETLVSMPFGHAK